MHTICWKKERLQHTRYVNRTCVALVLQGPLCKTTLKCIKQTGDCELCRQGQDPASDLKCLFLFKLYKRMHSISLHCGHDTTESPWATFSFSDQSEAFQSGDKSEEGEFDVLRLCKHTAGRQGT